MKASLVDNGFGKGRKCVELVPETDEEREILERLRLGYGMLGHQIVVAGDGSGRVSVDVLAFEVTKTAEGGREVRATDDWESPSDGGSS